MNNIIIELNDIIEDTNKYIEVYIKLNEESHIKYNIEVKNDDINEMKKILKSQVYDYIESSIYIYNEIICNY